MSTTRTLKIIFWLLILPIFVNAQGGYIDNDGKILAVNFSFGGQNPGGDLENRFGYFSNLGGGVEYITEKNWIIGADTKFMYGKNVNELTTIGLYDDEGFIFGGGGVPASVQLRQRGLYVGGHIGKLFSVIKSNPRSGIRINIGAGFLQHKIRIQNDPSASVTLLSGEYIEGYDRLTNGYAFNQFVGYQHVSKNRRVNLTVGFDFTQAFTQNQRAINFDTRMKDETKRKDYLNGFRISWTLPFYLNSDGSEIYY